MKILSYSIFFFAVSFTSHSYAKWPFYFFGPALQNAKTIATAENVELLSHQEAQNRLCSLTKINCKLDSWDSDKAKFHGNTYKFILTELHEKPGDNSMTVGYWVQYFVDYDRAERADIPIHEIEWQRSYLIYRDGTKISLKNSLYRYGSIPYLSKDHGLLLPYLQAKNVSPEVLDGKVREYWIQTFDYNGKAGAWFKKNTWSISPEFSILNYHRYSSTEQGEIDNEKTSKILEKLFHGEQKKIFEFRTYKKNPPQYKRVNGKLMQVEETLVSFPNLVLIGATASELEFGLFYDEALSGKARTINPDETLKFDWIDGLKKQYEDKCNPEGFYWLSKLAENSFKKSVFKISLDTLNGFEEIGGLSFAGGSHPIDFRQNPVFVTYVESLSAGDKRYKRERPDKWIVNSWFLNFQGNVKERYFIRDFSGEQYESLLIEAEKKILNECTEISKKGKK